MRVTWISLAIGFAACSGEPFSATHGPRGELAGPSAGSGSQPTASAGMANAAAGGKAPAEASAGATATSGEAEPSTGGEADGAGGEPTGEGGAPATPACPTKAGSDWELGYFPELREASSFESHPFFQVTNLGAPLMLNRITIRYYFTKELDIVETAACYWVTGDRCSLAKLDFGDVSPPTASASRYLEVSFPGASNVTLAAERLEVRVGFKTGSGVLIQTNDYSFDSDAAAPSSAAPFPYKRWLQATLYLDGELVWGAEPCSLDDVLSTSNR